MMHRRPFFFLITGAMVLTALTASRCYGQETLEIKLSNVELNKGILVVEIYTSSTGWLTDPFRKVELPTDRAVQTATFQVPYGKYAITVYQDLNSNGEPDMNFLGIPKEPVGFGNDHRPFGEPKFEAALIEFNATARTHEIKLFEVF